MNSTKFVDALGREWDLRINGGTIVRVRELCGLDLGGSDPQAFMTLGNESGKLVDVLCAIVRPQLKAADVSDEEFAEGLDGETLDLATNALVEGLLRFQPGGKALALRSAFGKIRNLQASSLDALVSAIEGATPEQLADRIIQQFSPAG